MMIFELNLLSCQTVEEGGGIYRFKLGENGVPRKAGYLPCNRPMYAVPYGGRLHILLRAPFDDSENSGYFSCAEDFSEKTEIRDTLGRVACHLCVTGKDVYIANYLSGNIVQNCERAVAHTGRGANELRQEAPHTHCVIPSPCGKYVLCTDLGTDTLYTYDRDLTFRDMAKVPRGYGIRHIVFSKDGKYIYAVNELVPSVSVFEWKTGRTCYKKTERLTDAEGATGAAIRFSKDGKFLYCSVRGENTLYVLEMVNGDLRMVQKCGSGGNSPRDFDVFGDKYLVCCNEDGGASIFALEKNLIREKMYELPLVACLCVAKSN